MVCCQVPVNWSWAPFERVTVPVNAWPVTASTDPEDSFEVAENRMYVVAVEEPAAPMLHVPDRENALLVPAQVIVTDATAAVPVPVLTRVRYDPVEAVAQVKVVVEPDVLKSPDRRAVPVTATTWAELWLCETVLTELVEVMELVEATELEVVTELEVTEFVGAAEPVTVTVETEVATTVVVAVTVEVSDIVRPDKAPVEFWSRTTATAEAETIKTTIIAATAGPIAGFLLVAS